MVENQRQKLASLPEFEPFSAFQRMDRDQDCIITSVDILNFLRQNQIEEINESDCYSIVKYFDSKGHGNLAFNDFLQIVMPCDEPSLRADIA